MATSVVKSKRKILQIFLATAIKNGSKNGESLEEVERTCRFVAASFYYRDLPSIEDILRHEQDSAVTQAVHQAMCRAGLRGAK